MGQMYSENLFVRSDRSERLELDRTRYWKDLEWSYHTASVINVLLKDRLDYLVYQLFMATFTQQRCSFGDTTQGTRKPKFTENDWHTCCQITKHFFQKCTQYRKHACVCMYICMYICMYVYMDGWMDGWVDVYVQQLEFGKNCYINLIYASLCVRMHVFM